LPSGRLESVNLLDRWLIHACRWRTRPRLWTTVGTLAGGRPLMAYRRLGDEEKCECPGRILIGVREDLEERKREAPPAELRS
jgi:hypothetical protein